MLAKHLCRATTNSCSKILFFIFCIIFTCVLPSVSFAEFSGSGTNENPYIISSAEDIKQLAFVLGNSKEANLPFFGTKYYRIVKDIDLKNEDFAPIANFRGYLDGGGHTIKNLNIVSNSSCDSHYGLFGNLASAEIKNLCVTGNVIVSSNQTDNYKKIIAGGIAGSAKDRTRIINCEFRGTVQSKILSVPNKSAMAGGIVGEINGSIDGCMFCGKVVSESGNQNNGAGSFAGGIAGLIENNERSCCIKNCVSQAEVSANGSTSNIAGGIVGQSNIADNSRFYGNLYAKSETVAHGIGNVIFFNGVENQHNDTGCSVINK